MSVPFPVMGTRRVDRPAIPARKTCVLLGSVYQSDGGFNYSPLPPPRLVEAPVRPLGQPRLRAADDVELAARLVEERADASGETRLAYDKGPDDAIADVQLDAIGAGSGRALCAEHRRLSNRWTSSMTSEKRAVGQRDESLRQREKVL
jgi:hypothetical protein